MENIKVAREVKEVLADFNYLLADVGDAALAYSLLVLAYGDYDASLIAEDRELESSC